MHEGLVHRLPCHITDAHREREWVRAHRLRCFRQHEAIARRRGGAQDSGLTAPQHQAPGDEEQGNNAATEDTLSHSELFHDAHLIVQLLTETHGNKLYRVPRATESRGSKVRAEQYCPYPCRPPR